MQSNEIFSKMIDRANLTKEVEHAKEQFENKPFIVEYRKVKKVSAYARYGLALFSLVTGFGFLNAVFVSALPSIVAVVLAAITLVLVEVLKSQLGGIAFRSFYRSGKLPAVALGAVGMFALSVFFSLHGVGDLYTQLDKSEAELLTRHTAGMDSVNQLYNNKLAEKEKQLSEFKASVSWKGKVNMYNKATAQTIERYNSEITAMNEQFNAAKASIEHTQNSELTVTKAGNEFNLSAWVAISAAVELSILLCIWFAVYYAYRAASDSAAVASSERFTINIEELKSFAEHAFIGGHRVAALPMAETKQPIGFRANRSEPLPAVGEPSPNRSRTVPNEGITVPEPFQSVPSRGITVAEPLPNAQKSLVNTGIKRGYLVKYPEVVNSLKDGVSIADCVKLHGVSRSTVQNVKRVLRSA